ncbi:MAG: YccF domain-containing protein [Sulfurospirillaceae bacterium]|nr:YccF domain-containing protein [Sulfurospirillaceae bacterium]
MRLLGNIIWFLFGGLVMGLAWWMIGLIALLTIVGIPWAKACFVMGQFTFFPFGKEAVSRKALHLHEDIGTGTWGLIGNVLWFIFAGFWLAIGHILSAIACAITIIGIPFAIQHLKLVVISLAPIGMTIVDKEVASAIRQKEAEAFVQQSQNR